MARLLSSKIIVLSIFLFFSQLSDNYDIGNNNNNGINESDKIVLGWLKPYRGLPKVLISISIVIFPISYAPRVSPSEKY